MTTIILTSIAIYIISSISMYKWMQIAHFKEGIFNGLDVKTSDLLITLTPMINTFMSLIVWAFSHPKKKETNYNRFFNIKR